MQAHQYSRTAEAAAGLRAIHRRIDRPVIFDDPYAEALTSASLRLLARRPGLATWLMRDPLGLVNAARGHVVGRARFAEDKLAQAVAAGCGQYVIVGAGLDSFAARRPPGTEDVQVFELDHPATQAAKRQRLGLAAQVDWQRVSFVPIDFESQALAEALEACPEFDAQQPAFFSWLGTTPYLSREAIFATLASIAQLAAPGSEIALDFSVAHKSLARRRGAVMGLFLLAYTRWLSEPLIDNGLPRDAFVGECAKLGFLPQEVLDVAAVCARYFAASQPPLKSLPGTCFAHFVLE